MVVDRRNVSTNLFLPEPMVAMNMVRVTYSQEVEKGREDLVADGVS